MSPPVRLPSYEGLDFDDPMLPFASLDLDSKLGLVLPGVLDGPNASLIPTNRTPKSSQARLTPDPSRTMTLPETRSPNGLTNSRNPPGKPLSLHRESVSAEARTATCGATPLSISSLTSGDPAAAAVTGETDLPSPDKSVELPIVLSAPGVEDPERIEDGEAVAAKRVDREGLGRYGSEVSDALGDWFRRLGRCIEESRSGMSTLRREAGGGLVNSGMIMPRAKTWCGLTGT